MTITFINDWISDLFILKDILDQLSFQTSSTRQKNMLSVPKSQGGSMLYGSTFRKHPAWYSVQREVDPNNPKLNLTKAKSDYPELQAIFEEFSSLYFPDFKWNSVHLNKNYPCTPHFDSKNIGESILVALGDYKGGDTCLYNEKSRIIEKYDARKKHLKFDGSKILHWVSPIKGNEDRYSLVFFYSTRN